MNAAPQQSSTERSTVAAPASGFFAAVCRRARARARARPRELGVDLGILSVLLLIAAGLLPTVVAALLALAALAVIGLEERRRTRAKTPSPESAP